MYSIFGSSPLGRTMAAVLAEEIPVVDKYMHTWERLGTVIRSRREELHLSISDVAQRANVEAGFIHDLESAKSSTRIRDIRKVLDSLRIFPLLLPMPKL